MVRQKEKAGRAITAVGNGRFQRALGGGDELGSSSFSLVDPRAPALIL